MHTQDQLKIVSELIRKLSSINHPDASRIAKEIATEYNYDKDQILDVVTRITDGEPWEYIRGYAVFKGGKFIVNNDVLIPRIETEQLVDISLQLLKKYSINKVIDVGTGSGAIICTIAKETSNKISFLGIDVSGKALKIAKANAKLLGVSNIVFKKSSLLSGPRLKSPTLIVANLPYISSVQYRNLPDSVKLFEPKVALDGGYDGNVLIKKLLLQCLKQREHIKAIVLEMDTENINDLVRFLFKHFSGYKVRKIRDIYRRPRFIAIEG